MQAPLAVVVGPFSTVNSAPGLKGTSQGMGSAVFLEDHCLFGGSYITRNHPQRNSG